MTRDEGEGGVSATAADTAGTAPRAEARPGCERLGDRLNPIVVKEVRQGLRTARLLGVLRADAAGLPRHLARGLRHTRTTVASPPRARASSSPSSSAWALVHFFIIPYSAYRSMAREREDETWVLLTLTGLGPRRILRGKVASFLVQAALYASAAGPFLLFSYYLNGIDLPTILVMLGLGGLAGSSSSPRWRCARPRSPTGAWGAPSCTSSCWACSAWR